jgi:hypothetical protein
MSAPLSKNYAVRIRTQLGLRHDLAYIQELAQKPDLNVSELGTPITDDELTDLQQRRALGFHVPAVEALILGDPNYASIWFDQIPGGGVQIALTSEPTPQQTERVVGLLPAGARITYVRVRYTRAELQSLADTILESSTFDPGRAGLLISGISVSGRNNVVEVSFRTEHDLAAFLERFGSDPRIEARVRPTPSSLAC